MREINIEVYDNKKIKVSDKGNLGDKFDHYVSRLVFDFDNCNFIDTLKYRYFLYKYREDEDYIPIYISGATSIPLMHVFSSNPFMDRAGTLDCLIVLSNKDLSFKKWENDIYDWVSNQFSLYIQDNFLVDYKNLNVKENKEAI